ncbi:MAG TPA: hypothetical protein ENG28_04775 [Deltaproteobacteria bacterium]|nr:hypothetical protein [Deltaproteobacteria bacterium]
MKFRYTAVILYLSSAFLVMGILGCAALQSYEVKASHARYYINTGQYSDALACFPEYNDGNKNEVLYCLERGTLLQAKGEYRMSARQFEKAAQLMRYYENKAYISASRTASQAGSLIINEQIMPYRGEDFEKVLVHALDAINYLMLGDIDNARVEIRNVYTREKELYKKHEKEIEKAHRELQGLKWEDSFIKAYPQGFNSLRKKSAYVVSVYQNAFAYYLSSFVYELNGEPDEAYIDLKNAFKAEPWSRQIGKDLVRLSRELNYYDDLELWKRRFGDVKSSGKDSIDVLVILELGLGPVKQEARIPIPLRRGGFTFASFPVYTFTPSLFKGANIIFGDNIVTTSTLMNVDATAAKDLMDMFPILFAKQVVRSYIKARATKELSRKYGALGAVSGSVATALTERADLRSWSTLPKEIQIARIHVPRYKRKLLIRTIPPRFNRYITIPRGAKHVVVLCRITDYSFNTDTKTFF